MTLNDYLFILQGIFTTMHYTLIAVICGFIIAIPIAAMRMSTNQILSLIARFYISIMRGTPVILQLSAWYFVFPRATGIHLSAVVAGSIAFTINSSAYIAEIIRSGVLAIDKGQLEAAKVLGISKKDTLLDILLPQAVRNISPTIINEIISMIKETAIIGMIGVPDLMRRAQLVSAEKYDFFTPLITAAVGYYCLGLFITFIYQIIAKRLLR